MHQTAKCELDGSISSLAWRHEAEGVCSVGYDSGSITLHQASDLSVSKEFMMDKRMCVVDHIWLDKRVICFTEGRNITFYDCEKMTNIGSLVGHLDVE